MNTVISYPVPLYANVPIHAEYYQPSRYAISAITLGLTTIVTTSTDHNYVIGQLVRLLIPQGYGTIQLSNQVAYVISIPAANQVTLNISSAGMDAFVNGNRPTVAQILAVGDVNSGVLSNTGSSNVSTNIPGSFINISP